MKWFDIVKMILVVVGKIMEQGGSPKDNRAHASAIKADLQGVVDRIEEA